MTELWEAIRWPVIDIIGAIALAYFLVAQSVQTGRAENYLDEYESECKEFKALGRVIAQGVRVFTFYLSSILVVLSGIGLLLIVKLLEIPEHVLKFGLPSLLISFFVIKVATKKEENIN